LSTADASPALPSSAAPGCLIEARGLTKSFGGREVLRGVDLAVGPGEIVALMGPSGSGKSTLLRCLNGLERPDGGTLRVADHVFAPPHGPRVAWVWLRQKVGFVFQQWHLFAHRTALENVTEAPVHVQGLPAQEAREEALRLLGRMGVAHRAHAYPHELSGGEQQRVALARALAMKPLALLLDEPTSALDPARRADLAALLKHLADEGLAFVVVTHDAAWAASLDARPVHLVEGLLEPGPEVTAPA
jgi:polar amino acid transport system ATP-binding protein